MVVHLWGRCPSRIGFPFGSFAAVLFGFSLLIQSQTVFADSTPYPAELDWRARLFDPVAGRVGMYPGYSSDDVACRAVIANSFNASVTYLGVAYTFYGYSRGDCRYYDAGREQVVTDGWDRSGTCPQGGATTDYEGLRPMCACPAGWMFPPGGKVYGGGRLRSGYDPKLSYRPNTGIHARPVPGTDRGTQPTHADSFILLTGGHWRPRWVVHL